jgi:hypothetical protein
MYTMLLPPCSTEVLHVVLDPSVAHVWIVGHNPGSHLHWWNAAVPLSETSTNRTVLVRDLQFDLLMRTDEFLRYELEFRHGGITLVQVDRPVSDTLLYSRLPNERRYQILRANGLHLEFELPHSGEYASVSSPSRSTLERLIGGPAFQSG